MSVASSLVISSGELAALLGAELRGPGDVRLSGLAPLEAAGADDLSFVRNPRFLDLLSRSEAGAVLVSRSVLEGEAAERVLGNACCALLIVENADLAMVALLEQVAAMMPSWGPEVGIDSSASVSSSVEMGRDVRVGAGVVIGPGSRIGDGAVLHPGVYIGGGVEVGGACVLHPGVRVLDRCVIGREVVLWPGVVIGTDGFGYRPSVDGPWLVKIPHVGNVVIGDRVEIGANTTIDRGKFGATRIGPGSKIDNQVQIAHNCVVGRSCVICGCCALAGSVVLGDGVTLGGAARISDNRRVGDGATAGAGSGVMHNIPPGETWLGVPARPVRHTLRIFAATGELPDMVRALRRLRGRGGSL